MFLLLTKLNTNPKKLYIPDHKAIASFTSWSKDESQGAELTFANGNVYHVRETAEEIATLIRKDYELHAVASKEQT